MGDISRDPIDHARTSRPRVGQTLKTPNKFVGLLFITVGLVAFAIGLVCFAHRQAGTGVAAVVVASVAVGVGGVWLAREARRARRFDDQQIINHRDSAP